MFLDQEIFGESRCTSQGIPHQYIQGYGLPKLYPGYRFIVWCTKSGPNPSLGMFGRDLWLDCNTGVLHLFQYV